MKLEKENGVYIWVDSGVWVGEEESGEEKSVERDNNWEKE